MYATINSAFTALFTFTIFMLLIAVYGLSTGSVDLTLQALKWAMICGVLSFPLFKVSEALNQTN